MPPRRRVAFLFALLLLLFAVAADAQFKEKLRRRDRGEPDPAADNIQDGFGSENYGIGRRSTSSKAWAYRCAAGPRCRRLLRARALPPLLD
jgi:hypothetical protein